MEYRIAIIGPKKMTSGFKALGVDIFDAENGEQALAALKNTRATADTNTTRYAVVILMEKLVKEIPEDEYTRATQGALPAVVILPGIEGSSGEGIAKLKKLAERAVGSDILG